MKKMIFIALLTTIMCQTGFATAPNQQTTVDALFSNFSKEKNKTHVKLGGLIMRFANVFSDSKGVTNLEVFSFEDCDKSVRDNLNEAIKNLKDDTYETLVSTSENGERTKVLVRIKDDYINEIVVATGGDDPALIRIKGKIKPDDVDGVIKNKK